MAWVYILRCTDGSFYVGSTNNLDLRLEQHMTGNGAKYTSRRLPVELVWSEDYEYVSEAWAVERQLHGWSRAKKQLLIDGHAELLAGYSDRGRQDGSQRT